MTKPWCRTEVRPTGRRLSVVRALPSHALAHRVQVATDAGIVGHQAGGAFQFGGGLGPAAGLAGDEAESEVKRAGLAGCRNAVPQQLRGLRAAALIHQQPGQREAAEQAISSPLLEASIDGAHGVLLSIAGGSDLGLFEVSAAAQLIEEAAHDEANIIFGTVIDANDEYVDVEISPGVVGRWTKLAVRSIVDLEDAAQTYVGAALEVADADDEDAQPELSASDEPTDDK